MEINTQISGESWGKIGKDEAIKYLHSYPKDSKIELSRYIAEKKSSPRVLDLGCGNAQLYPILKDRNPNLVYKGVDIADSLVEVAREVVGDPSSIIKEDLFSYIGREREFYDFIVLGHMLECSESPEFLVSNSMSRCESLAVLWFDYPKYEYDSIFINSNPHSSGSHEFRPYIRRKIGSSYWNFILDKNNMVLSHRAAFGDNNILEIFTKK